MKNLAKMLLLVAVLFSAASLVVSGAAFLITVLTAGDVAGGVPMYYYEKKLSLQWLTILLPFFGMVAFLLALPGVLSDRKTSTESAILTFPAKPSSDENKQRHLKAA